MSIIALTPPKSPRTSIHVTYVMNSSSTVKSKSISYYWTSSTSNSIDVDDTGVISKSAVFITSGIPIDENLSSLVVSLIQDIGIPRKVLSVM